MRGYFLENDQLPPCKTLASLLGVTKNAAAEMLLKLERIGVIERNANNKFKRGANW